MVARLREARDGGKTAVINDLISAGAHGRSRGNRWVISELAFFFLRLSLSISPSHYISLPLTLSLSASISLCLSLPLTTYLLLSHSITLCISLQPLSLSHSLSLSIALCPSVSRSRFLPLSISLLPLTLSHLVPCTVYISLFPSCLPVISFLNPLSHCLSPSAPFCHSFSLSPPLSLSL